MKSSERVQQIECDIHCLPIAKAPLPPDKLIERLPVDELGDEIPAADRGPASPVDLHHVGVIDLPQGTDLPAHRLIPGGAVEDLERPLLILDLIVDAVNLRKAALPYDAQNLETALEDVADSVVGSLGPSWGQHVSRVGLRERPAATRRRSFGRIAAVSRCGLADAAGISCSGLTPL